MKQLWIVIRHEYLNFTNTKSFKIVTLIFSLLIIGGLSFPRIADFFSSDNNSTDSGGSADSKIAVIDHLHDENLISALNLSLETIEVVDQQTEAEIKEAVASEDYDFAIVINSITDFNYIIADSSLYDNTQLAISNIFQENYENNALLAKGLTKEEIQEIKGQQINYEVIQTGVDSANYFLFTYIIIMVLYISILMYGQQVATGVATEKSNRAMETLITSANPRNLFFGKIIGSGLAGLTQIIIFALAVLIGYNLNKAYILNIPFIATFFDIPTHVLVYSLLFFIFGFFLYAFLYGALASTVSKVEEVAPVISPITFIFIAGFMITTMSTSGDSLNSTLLIVSSYIPFFSPMAMLSRVAMTSVPIYEVAISIAILVATTILIGLAASKIYHFGVLYYGNRLNMKKLITAMRHKK